MKWLSSGCWLLKREAVEEMANNYKNLIYNGDGNESNKIIYGLYNTEIVELEYNNNKIRKLLSEDWIFCKRWTDLGHKIFADTSIVLNHIGKYPYKMWSFK